MKNFFKIFGISILAVVFGFSMLACSDDGGSDELPKFWLNVSNLPTGITKIYADVYNENTEPTTWSELQVAQSDTMISNVPNVTNSPIELVQVFPGTTFPGSGNFLVYVAVNTSNGVTYYHKFKVVNFVNGSGTVNWNTMTDCSTLPGY